MESKVTIKLNCNKITIENNNNVSVDINALSVPIASWFDFEFFEFFK